MTERSDVTLLNVSSLLTSNTSLIKTITTLLRQTNMLKTKFRFVYHAQPFWQIIFAKLANFDFWNWYLGTNREPIPSPKLYANKSKNFSHKNSTVIFMMLKCQRFFPFILFMFYFIREIAQCLQLNEGEIYSDSFLQHRTRPSILGSDSSIN